MLKPRQWLLRCMLPRLIPGKVIVVTAWAITIHKHHQTEQLAASHAPLASEDADSKASSCIWKQPRTVSFSLMENIIKAGLLHALRLSLEKQKREPNWLHALETTHRYQDEPLLRKANLGLFEHLQNARISYKKTRRMLSGRLVSSCPAKINRLIVLKLTPSISAASSRE